MKKMTIAMGLLIFSSAAFAQANYSACQRVAFISQNDDYIVLNGRVRIIKSEQNASYLAAALRDRRIRVCPGTETDIWGNVDIVSVLGLPGYY